MTSRRRYFWMAILVLVTSCGEQESTPSQKRTSGVITYRLIPARGSSDSMGSRIDFVPPEDSPAVPPAPPVPLEGSFDVVPAPPPLSPNVRFAFDITRLDLRGGSYTVSGSSGYIENWTLNVVTPLTFLATVVINGTSVQLTGDGDPTTFTNQSPPAFTGLVLQGSYYHLTLFAEPEPVAPTPFRLSSFQQSCGDQTAAGIVSTVEPEYDLTLVPRSNINLSAMIPLTLRVTYLGGKITCYPGFTAPPALKEADVLDEVGVVVQMQFATEGGAFNEQFDTEIKGREEQVSFSYATTPERLKGTYRPDLPGYQDVEVGFFGNFGGAQAGGEVVQSGIPPGHVSQLIPVAGW